MRGKTQTVPLPTNFETVEDDEVRKSAALTIPPDEAPTTEFGTVVDFLGPAGTAPPNASRKPQQARESRREWLTEAEVERLCAAARKRGRWGHRDATMILFAYRHGLRVSELVALKWQHVDLEAGRVRVIRSKGSDDSVQPLSGAEIRALRRIRREQQTGERYVFVSERRRR